MSLPTFLLKSESLTLMNNKTPPKELSEFDVKQISQVVYYKRKKIVLVEQKVIDGNWFEETLALSKNETPVRVNTLTGFIVLIRF